MKRPPPLRTDGSNAFARVSMTERLPRIARDVALRGAVGAASAARLERLARDIETNAALPLPLGPAPDLAAWQQAHAERAGRDLARHRVVLRGARVLLRDRAGVPVLGDRSRPVRRREGGGARRRPTLAATRGRALDRPPARRAAARPARGGAVGKPRGPELQGRRGSYRDRRRSARGRPGRRDRVALAARVERPRRRRQRRHASSRSIWPSWRASSRTPRRASRCT